jgi:MSHA biogenesis protein MshI
MQLGINPKGWTSIDNSEHSSLCAVSVKTTVRGDALPQVLAAAEQVRPDGDDERAALGQLADCVDRTLPVLMTLSRSHYKLRVMPEPAVPLREMQSSLRWSLSTDSDGPVDEFNLAWFRIPTEEQMPSRPRQVYAVMAATAQLNARLAAWKQAGVRPKVVDIRETALRNICGALERPGEGLALVSADVDGVSVVFTHQRSLYLDRYVQFPEGGPAVLEPTVRDRLYERVAMQLHRSIEVVSRTYPFMPVTRVVLAASPDCPGLREALSARVQAAIEPLDLNQVFDLSRVPELAQSPALQSRCLVSLGASLRSAKVAQ